ncbi:Kelch repeat-containing protein, partial [Acidithiobacillus sp.]|uniref:Kelch repeat-containing protein n=1 Tax=Acidithiobacillus sp. TaxID=1872118 RepID=UPI003CFCA040
GNLWLYGGNDVNGNTFNDLWEYSISTNIWTWINGSNDLNAGPQVTTLGETSTSNAPGGLSNSVSWTDSSGNFWLFGGCANGLQDSSGQDSYGSLNTLWMYSISTNSWTWINGSLTVGDLGYNGLLNVPSKTNEPASRVGSVVWRDRNENIWIYGGEVLDAANEYYGGVLDDFWEYIPSSNIWVWKSGTNVTVNGPKSVSVCSPDYGVLGISSTTNYPGSRELYMGWVDNNGNLWMFGGSCYSSSLPDDLWRYQP